MNDEKDKQLDELFGKSLKDPVDETRYKEEDWDALEQMLDQNKKRKGIIYWLPVLSGVAALLLLFLGWWALRVPQKANHVAQNSFQAIKNQRQANKKTDSVASIQYSKNKNKKELQASVYTGSININAGKKGAGKKAFITGSVFGKRHFVDSAVTGGGNIIANTANEILSAQNRLPLFEPEQGIEGVVTPIDLLKNNAGYIAKLPADKNGKSKIKPVTAFRPQYALTVLAAPDINGVGSFQQSKVGTNVGMQFSAGVTKKLTITTGVLYSSKPYTVAFQDYHTVYNFKEAPLNVTADCRMIDIPINLGYQVYNKHQNKISLGTGLSSYIMLHESYKFNYSDPYAVGPTAYTVPRSNKYFLGVLNLNATYDRQINSKMAIEIQPYLKLPLTNIGYSQVKLQSTGVAVGLHWNINSSSKP
ncbi:MAG: hypothetical protein JWP44_3532 [Mucilaginibacter sp.]|nr:hypothetical protein [Mucilaginibacter sp.]